MKLLNVDDNPDNLYLIETTMQRHGHAVVSAANGREALEKLKGERFDLIISDILMPEMDGFQLCREVMSRADLRSTPFVFYTATFTSKRDEQFGLSLGATHFLSKPMEPDLLVELISKIVDEGPSRREALSSGEDDSSFLRAHNEQLVNKLSTKMAELRDAHSSLETQIVEKEKEITRRKRAEEELALTARRLGQTNQDLLQFAYAAAHDLQEPLRNVAHILELLQFINAGTLDEDAAGLIEDGVGAINRMHTMVTDLLAFTKIGETAQTDRYPSVDTNLVVQEVLKNLVVAFAETGGQLIFKGLLPVRVKRIHLIQLLQNLIGNSLKFCRKEVPPVVKLSCRRNENEACFTVEDNGIGFDPVYARQIFGIFKRLHASHEYPGTGIGLAICSRIVNLYGGRIWAESSPGEGSAFHFSLPLGEQSRQAAGK